MNEFQMIFIAIIYALFLVHEMDAIQNEEWRMFIFFKDMNSNNAYILFTLLHLPIYALLIMFTLSLKYQEITIMIVNIFLVFHTVLHLLFEKHSNNKLKSFLSRFIIYGMGVLAVLYLVITGV